MERESKSDDSSRAIVLNASVVFVECRSGDTGTVNTFARIGHGVVNAVSGNELRVIAPLHVMSVVWAIAHANSSAQVYLVPACSSIVKDGVVLRSSNVMMLRGSGKDATSVLLNPTEIVQACVQADVGAFRIIVGHEWTLPHTVQPLPLVSSADSATSVSASVGDGATHAAVAPPNHVTAVSVSVHASGHITPKLVDRDSASFEKQAHGNFLYHDCGDLMAPGSSGVGVFLTAKVSDETHPMPVLRAMVFGKMKDGDRGLLIADDLLRGPLQDGPKVDADKLVRSIIDEFETTGVAWEPLVMRSRAPSTRPTVVREPTTIDEAKSGPEELDYKHYTPVTFEGARSV